MPNPLGLKPKSYGYYSHRPVHHFGLIVFDETFLPNPYIDDLWRYAVPPDVPADLCWKPGEWEGYFRSACA